MIKWKDQQASAIAQLMQILFQIIFQSRAFVDVIVEGFGRVVSKIGHNRNSPIHCDSWIKSIHRRRDWDLLS
jgi:hypothetical protein